MKNRATEVRELAEKTYEKFEPELRRILEQLQDPMEASYFLAVLDRMRDTTLSLTIDAKPGEKTHLSVVWNQETAMKMLGETDGYHGQTWETTALRKIAIDCLQGEGCPDLFPVKMSCGNPKEAKAFKKAWKKIQGK